MLIAALKRILHSASWPFGLYYKRPLLLSLFVTFIALSLPLLLDAFTARFDGSYPSLPFQAFQGIALVPPAVIVTSAAVMSFALFGRPLASKVRWLIMIGTLICLLPSEPMFSSTAGNRPEGVGTIFSLYPVVGFYLTSLAALSAAVPLLWFLRNHRLPAGEDDPSEALLAAGGLLLAIVACAPASSWFGLLCAALALWLWSAAALTSRDRREARLKGAKKIAADELGWVSKLERAAELEGALRSSATTVKLVAGEMNPSEWSDRRDALESARDMAVDAVHLDRVPVRDLLLGVSLDTDRWNGAVRSLRAAAPIILVLTLLMIVRTKSNDLVPILFWITNLSQTIVPMVVLALLFGYFFDFLRGPTGLHKALNLSAVLCLAEIPAWTSLFVDGRALAAMLWSFSQHFLILLPSGVVGFDYSRMRTIEGHRFDWRRFTWFGDARLLSAGLAAGAAAAAPTLATLFSGPFADAVKSMATIVAPILTFGR